MRYLESLPASAIRPANNCPLQVQGLSSQIDGCTVLSNVSFSLQPGSLTGLIGPNGAGKSSLLRALFGWPLQAKFQGSVHLFDHDIELLTHKQRAEKIAYFPQKLHFEPGMQVADFLQIGRLVLLSQTRIEEALAQMHACHLSKARLGNLSGGELALVAMARIYASNAPLILLDEAISALDPYFALIMLERLQAMAKNGKTILLVLHDLTYAARFFDGLILMDRGQIKEVGAAEELLDKNALQQLYNIRLLNGKYERQNWAIAWEADKIE